MAPFPLGESAAALYELQEQVNSLHQRINAAGEDERRSGDDRRDGFRANRERRSVVIPPVVWELRGATGKPVTCYLHPRKAGLFLLTICMGDQEIHADRFRVESDALAYAAFLLDDYVKSGWTEVYRGDPRL